MWSGYFPGLAYERVFSDSTPLPLATMCGSRSSTATPDGSSVSTT